MHRNRWHFQFVCLLWVRLYFKKKFQFAWAWVRVMLRSRTTQAFQQLILKRYKHVIWGVGLIFYYFIIYVWTQRRLLMLISFDLFLLLDCFSLHLWWNSIFRQPENASCRGLTAAVSVAPSESCSDGEQPQSVNTSLPRTLTVFTG